MVTYGSDTSHHQNVSDMGAAVRSGNIFNFAKATEFINFRDPAYPSVRKAVHDAGGVFGAYHFARPGDPVAQANYFGDVATLQPGEIPCLDFEDVTITDAVGFSVAFCKRIIERCGTPPLVYLNTYFLTSHNWQPVVDLNCGLWFAKYDGNPDPTANVISGQWNVVAVKQYSSSGAVPGISVPVDRNSFAGTVDQLRKYAIAGSPPVPPPPIVVVHPDVFGWNLPPGHCYGSRSNPSAAVHGGYAAWERPFVANIQKWLVYRGCTSVAASRWASTTWADGSWGPQTDAAMVVFHQRFYPNQPAMNECWDDDYAKLARP